MIVMAVIGGLIVVALAVAGWYDYRARRRGRRFRLTANEALQNRIDSEVRANPFLNGGPQSWVPQRERDAVDGD